MVRTAANRKSKLHSVSSFSLVLSPANVRFRVIVSFSAASGVVVADNAKLYFTRFEQMNPRLLDVSQAVRHVVLYYRFAVFTCRCNNER